MEGGRFWFSTEFFGRENRQKLFFSNALLQLQKIGGIFPRKNHEFPGDFQVTFFEENKLTQS